MAKGGLEKKDGKMGVRCLAARSIAELPLIKAIKLVEQLSLITNVDWPLTRAVDVTACLERLVPPACVASI